MEITDLSWNENLSKRFNNPLLPRSIRGLIVGKSGCGKTTLLLVSMDYMAGSRQNTSFHFVF